MPCSRTKTSGLGTPWPVFFLPHAEGDGGGLTSLLEIRALCGCQAGWEVRVAWWWAGPVEVGMTLGCLLAPPDQVETQACTREQDRVCACRPGWYCMLQSQQGCRLCSELRKCPPGVGVSRPGMGPGQRAWDPIGSLFHRHQLVS